MMGDTLELSPSLCVPPTPSGATKSHVGPLSWHWVTLWGCQHPSVSRPHLVPPNPTEAPQCNLGVTFGLSPSLCVLPPFDATKSHKGPLSCCRVTLWSCHHLFVSCSHIVPPNPTGVPNAMMGDTLGLSPSVLSHPHLVTPNPTGVPNAIWVPLWACHHPPTPPFQRHHGSPHRCVLLPGCAPGDGGVGPAWRRPSLGSPLPALPPGGAEKRTPSLHFKPPLVFQTFLIPPPKKIPQKVEPKSPRHGGELVAEVLKAHGVRFVFALAGGHISPILVAAEKVGIRVVDTRHEATAVFAADAVSRLSGMEWGEGTPRECRAGGQRLRRMGGFGEGYRVWGSWLSRALCGSSWMGILPIYSHPKPIWDLQFQWVEGT